MSTARQAAMADIQEQIAEVELLKATGGQLPGFVGPPGTADYEQRITELKAQGQITKAQIARQDIYAKAEQAKQRARNSAYNLNRTLANFPAPGGVWLPAGILLFLYFAFFPVNSHVRLYWMFLVLTGNATWPKTETTTPLPTKPTSTSPPTPAQTNPNTTTYTSYAEFYTLLGGISI